MEKLNIKKLSKTAIIPTKAHYYDAGFDMYSDENVTIQNGEHYKIKTGIAVQIPEGHVGILTARSGINHKSPLRILLGIIDAGYEGDISVLVDNRSESSDYLNKYFISTYLKDYSLNYQAKYKNNNVYHIKQGDKIAQLVIVPISQFETNVVEEFTSQSERGDNGFGSTSI